MGQSAGGGAPPSSPTPPGTGGFGRFNMAAIQPNPGGFMGRAPQPMPMRAPANANLLDPQTLQTQAATMGRSMSNAPQTPATPTGSVTFGGPRAPMSLSGTAQPRSPVARPPMYAMSTPNLSAPRTPFGGFNTAALGKPSSLGMVRFAEGGSTGLGSGTPQSGGMFKGANLAAAHNSINSYLSQSNPSATQAAIASAMANMYGPRQPLPPARTAYRPEYVDYGLGATPQAQQFAIPSKMSIPTPDRPGSTGGSRFERPVASGMPQQTQKADPNLAILNQVLGPQPQYVYDSDGNSHPAPPQYMDASQRDALLANPSAYLDYAKYIQGGGDPTKFQRSAQPISMMTTAQREAFRKKQVAELSKLLPPAYVEDQGGA